MRSNLPVTQREYTLADGVTLMSTTDLHSRITYANAAFVEVSGYSMEELQGQPHNLVRHPDMPPQAFEDMWATLKAGLSWTALVKNRRKDGDHYWVRANATPVRKGQEVVGYMSVRTRPDPEDVVQAEAVYKAFREGQSGQLAFHRGLLIHTGWLQGWRSALQLLPVHWRIRVALGAAWALLAAAAWGLAGSVVAALVLTGCGALVCAGASAWLEWQLARPLRAVLAQALNVAAGQPCDIVSLDRVDEIGMIQRAVNQAGLNLRSLIADVDQQVDGLRHVSAEISGGNDDLSGRTEQAAASLQQTAASMDQLSATVKNNADAARQATELSRTASAVAQQGGDVVSQVVTTMADITASSRRIADIIGVIDGIAFQTNILALNAAVEAARAGEQGRGFAVVAAEVRSLAQRSAAAAHEIKALIGASVGRVDAGAQLVAAAGQTMSDIVAQVQRVNDLMGEISSASAEQSTGIDQMAVAVSDLDRMTQQNSALVEQSAAAAGRLGAQAGRLVEAIGVYRCA